ncbi:hypothetical protein BKA64DRAFT_688076 [Cadophora sp. MPI-SDFR-AT-0126]|nr:hypothetical protein BKA64DRAFT_688076 [Leotiomycetes sp. MPI-SDFR-AT-0126]
MATSLEALSEELLVRIVTLTERSSLHSLALTSRTLNRLVIPALYAAIDLKGGAADEGNKFLVPLTYHLLKNPDLASMVHSFSIRDVFSCEQDDLIPLDEGADTEYRKGWPADQDELDILLQKVVPDLEDAAEEQERLLKVLKGASDEGLIIATLISKLPNLQKLDIVGTMMSVEKGLLRFIQRVAKREPPFDKKPVLTKLKEVLISGWDEKYPNSPDMIGAYMELPSIRRIHGFQLGNNDQEEVTESLGALGIATSPVEELELRQTQLYAADLDRILKSCRNLKTFIYEVGHSWAWYTLRTSDIRNSMKAVEKTLENLVFDHSEYVGDAAEDHDELNAVSLAKFEKLRYLKISAMFLGGFKQDVKFDLRRTFPATLEELYVTYIGDPVYCPKWVPAALQEVFERKETVLPALRKFTLQGAFLNNADRLDAIKPLVQTAKGKGLEVVVLAEDADDNRKWDEKEERRWGLGDGIEWKTCWGNGKTEMTVLDVEGRGW